MNEKDLKDYLLDNNNISGSSIEVNQVFAGISYLYIVSCDLSVLKKLFPIKICIPENWKIYLVDIYYANSDRPFIPHIDQKGKICLFELEGVLIDWNLFGILDHCIKKAKDVIENGLKKVNQHEFLEEFDSYIANCKNSKKLKLVVPPTKQSQKISYCPTYIIKPEKKNKEKYLEYRNRIDIKEYFASVNPLDFKQWGYANIPQKNANYFYITPSEPILPPNISYEISKEYLNGIFKSGNIGELKCKLDKNIAMVIFAINQPNGNENYFGVIIEQFDFKLSEGVLELTSVGRITPLACERLDENFLISRTSESTNNLANKKYLLIGCGSIGSHVFYCLIKSGIKSITLVDHDILRAENIYRHLLGIESIKNSYKAEALKAHGDNALPNLKTTAVAERIEDAIREGSIDLSEYDFIIAASGDAILNRWINDYVYTNKITVPVFYLWNEPLDIGSHVGYFRLDYKSCYNCLFARDERGELYNKLAYTKKGQTITKSNAGCQGSFIPYGSLVSIQTSLLFLDALKNVINQRMTENTLYSQKGDNYYFKEAGFELSEVYENQKEKIRLIKGKDLVTSSCEICGGKET